MNHVDEPATPAAASTLDDRLAPIIADFRTAITTLKALSNERVLRLGLSMAQLNILYTLKRCGEMPMSRLAEMLNVSLSNATGLIDFAKKVFGAEEMMRMPGDTPEKIGHAEIKIGDSVVMLSDGNAMNAPGEASLLIYVNDSDAIYRKALDAGASSEQEPADQFYGDRTANVNAFGVRWYIHTHTEDVTPEEMEKRVAAMAGAQS